MNKNKVGLSWSRIRTWLKCPRWYRELYVEDNFDKVDNEYLLLGTNVHQACEFLLECKLTDRQDDIVLSDLKRGLNENIWSLYRDSDVDLDFELISSYNSDILPLLCNLTDEVKEEIGNFEVQGIETPFIAEISSDKLEYSSIDVSVQGFIDAVLKTDDFMYLFDWKISEGGWGRYKLNDTKVLGQLPFYRYLLSNSEQFKSIDKQTKMVYSVFNREMQELEFHYIDEQDVSSQDLLEIVDRMVYNSFESENFPPKHFSCLPFCDCQQRGIESWSTKSSQK